MNIIVLLSSILLLAGIGTSQVTPDCNCVLLRDCPVLYRPGQRLTFRQALEIRRRQCGIENSNLKVCCPSASVTRNRVTFPSSGTTPTPTPTFTPTPAPTPRVTLPSRQQCGQSNTLDKIHGGVDAQLGAHPWVVALGYLEPVNGGRNQIVKFKCGGSLITSQHVVTAAHCLHPRDIGSQTLTQLNIGDWNTQTDPDCQESFGKFNCAPAVEVRRPLATHLHPEYHSNQRYNNDIAVIKLDRPVEFSTYIRPICIADTFSAEAYSTPLATGWGTTETSEFSDILQEVRLPFTEFSACNQSFRGLLSTNQLCAGGVEGRDTCFGDSGGPLVAAGRFGPPFDLVGLTSFGKSYCGVGGNYGVYTVVSDFKNWIIEKIQL